MNRPLVLQSEDLDHAAGVWLNESCDLVACHFSDQPRFDELLAKAQGLVVRTYTRVDAALLDKAPNLKVVGRAGVGLDRINIPECRRRGVEVVYTPAANTVAVAEYVFGMLFSMLRPLKFLDGPIPQDVWNRTRREREATSQLSEMALGIWGMGKIGSRVARIAAGLGMDVRYHDLQEVPHERRFGARPVEVDELLKASDIITIHVDSRPGNIKLLNQAAFAKMRPTGIFINTSRGFIVDEHALAAWLRASPSARALVDVHDPEPFGPDYPLIGLPNALLAPHLAASTATAHVNMSWVVKDIYRVLIGQAPEHPAP